MSLKCGEKVDVTLLKVIVNSGAKGGGFKFFSKGLEITKGQSLTPGLLIEGDQIVAVQGLGKPKQWKRFEKPYEHSTWSCNGRYADALTFKPQKNIIFAGFSSWAAKDDTSYDLKYQIEVDDSEVIKTDWENRSGWVEEN